MHQNIQWIRIKLYQLKMRAHRLPWSHNLWVFLVELVLCCATRRWRCCDSNNLTCVFALRALPFLVSQDKRPHLPTGECPCPILLSLIKLLLFGHVCRPNTLSKTIQEETAEGRRCSRENHGRRTSKNGQASYCRRCYVSQNTHAEVDGQPLQ